MNRSEMASDVWSALITSCITGLIYTKTGSDFWQWWMLFSGYSAIKRFWKLKEAFNGSKV